MNRKIAAAVITAVIILSGCSQGSATSAGSEAVQSASAEKSDNKEAISLGESTEIFNRKLFSKMAGEENLFYSPYSLESALIMADAGAAGDTKAQMEELLGITDLDSTLKSYNDFRNITQPDTAKLSTANSIWIDSEYIKKAGNINPEYSDKVGSYMGTVAHTADFAKDTQGTLEEITAWVKQNTGGLISDYKAAADKNTVIDIINAVYFYGKWQNPFPAENTQDQEFRGIKGSSVVKMMNNEDIFLKYYDDGKFKGIEMPYADSTTVMDIILPEEDTDNKAGALWAAYSDERQNRFIKGLDGAQEQEIGELRLPKFTMDMTADNIKQTLISLGMTDAVDPAEAEFSGIADNLYISDINHRAKIEVDEEGSRAAAVTEIGVRATAMPPGEEEPVEFICDRPFIFMIRDTKTGVVLFMGMVNNL